MNQFCDKCDLCKTVRSICVGDRGEKYPKLYIIGEAPGPEEDVANAPFVGKAGKLLTSYIRDNTEIVLSEVRFGNIVRCWPSNNGVTTSPPKKSIDVCIEYLYQELLDILEYSNKSDTELPILIPLGNTALEALTGHKKITLNHGIEFTLKIPEKYRHHYGVLDGKFKVMGTIHPSAVLRGNQSYIPTIISDLTLAWDRYHKNEDELNYWKDYDWVENPDQVTAFVDEAIDRYSKGELDFVAYDLETTGLDIYDVKNQKTVCFNLSMDPGKAIVVPLHHKDSPWKNDGFVMSRIVADLGRLLSSVPICGWNLSFDVKWTWLYLGLEFKEIAFDGFLASKWLYGTRRRTHDLNTYASELLGFLGHGMDISAEVKNLSKNQQHYGNISIPTLLRYAGGDADASLQICRMLRDAMLENGGAHYNNFMNLSGRAIIPIARMEVDGVFINQNINKYLLKRFESLMEPHILAIENNRWGDRAKVILAERKDKNGNPKPLEFNLGSTESLRVLLFKVMGLVSSKAGKTGPSSDRESVEEMIETCHNQGKTEEATLLRHLNEFRALKHTYTNFVKNIPEYTKFDGFFHTQYNIAGTDTGRVSSYKPSIHGQPKDSEVRQQFVSRWAKKGGLIISADMKQMEMRVLASLSKDQNLIEAIKSGVDLHTANASRMFNVAVEEVTKKQREMAKRSGFGVVYGIGAQKLAANIESTESEAQGIINAWYDAFPGTLQFQKNEHDAARHTGCVCTKFGRLRWIENVERSKWGDRAWRQSINTNIQSSASDITFLALLEIFDMMEGMRSKVFGFVHDSIIIDVHPSEILKILDIQREKMVRWSNEVHDWMLAPTDIDQEIGPSWGFKCSVESVEDDVVIVKGDKANLRILRAELRNTPHFEELDFVDGEKMSFRAIEELGLPF